MHGNGGGNQAAVAHNKGRPSTHGGGGNGVGYEGVYVHGRGTVEWVNVGVEGTWWWHVCVAWVGALWGAGRHVVQCYAVWHEPRLGQREDMKKAQNKNPDNQYAVAVVLLLLL